MLNAEVVVAFVRPDRWYIQPYADERAYVQVHPDGTYETWIRDWRQIAVFVIHKGYDALSEQQPHRPFPLRVDGVDVLAIAAYPTLQFAGYEWAVKAGDNLGPGPNPFSASSDNVWVDDLYRLHLKITHRDGRWHCAEAYLMRPLSYGTYTFYISSRVDLLDKNVVGSAFVYQDDEHEADIECSRWGNEEDPNAQFVVQPWSTPGHRERFHMSLLGDPSTHIIGWQPGSVFFQSAQGHHPHPAVEQIIHEWSYTGDHVPTEVMHHRRQCYPARMLMERPADGPHKIGDRLGPATNPALLAVLHLVSVRASCEYLPVPRPEDPRASSNPNASGELRRASCCSIRLSHSIPFSRSLARNY